MIIIIATIIKIPNKLLPITVTKNIGLYEIHWRPEPEQVSQNTLQAKHLLSSIYPKHLHWFYIYSYDYLHTHKPFKFIKVSGHGVGLKL
jgi:hypothetical protein